MGAITIYIPDAAERLIIAKLGEKEKVQPWCKMHLMEAIRKAFGNSALADSRALWRNKKQFKE